MAGWPAWVLWVLGSAVSALGVAVIARALLWDRARGRRRCPRCWYDLSARAASEPAPCSECGHTARHARALLRTRRRWRMAFVGLVVLLAGVGAAVTPSMRGGKWHHWVPATAVIAVLPWTGEPWPWDELDRRLDVNEPGIQWLRREALWEWQWRWLARRCGEVAASEAPLGIRKRGLARVLNGCPDPSPGVEGVIACLRDDDRNLRALAAWGAKAARYDWDEPHRTLLLAALESAPEDADKWGHSPRTLALEALRAVPDQPPLPAGMSPDEMTRLLDGGQAATLARIHRGLGVFSRLLFWPYDGESGPLRATSHEPEVAGPGADRVILIADQSGTHWEMLIFLQRDDWVIGGCIGIGNQSGRAPDLRVERSPEGRAWLVLRSLLGSSGPDGSYALFGESWLAVRPGAVSLALQVPVQGHARRAGPAGQAVLAWSLETEPPRLFDRTVQYATTVRIEGVLPDPAGAATGTPARTFEIISERLAARFAERGGALQRVSGVDPFERIDALSANPDLLLEAAATGLLRLAREGSDEERAWVAAFARRCGVSEARRELEAALGPVPKESQGK